LGGPEQFEFWLKAVPVAIAAVTAIIAVMRYFGERKKENETARTESQKPFHTKQQEIYFVPPLRAYVRPGLTNRLR
jgi:hypothetical protein